MKKILIMGLSGSGKSTLAAQLVSVLPDAVWFNADEQRELHSDWDFSPEGRLRQARRMADLASKATHTYVIADFIAALEAQRDIFNPNLVIWMDTIQSCQFADTNKAFQPPSHYDLRFDSFDGIELETVLSLLTK